MIIRNLTFGDKAQNIMINSLRNEFMKDGHCIRPGEAMDTSEFSFSDMQVAKSQEIKNFEKDKLVGVYVSFDEEKAKRGDSIREQQDFARKKSRQDFLDEIESTDSLTRLEDAIQNSPDQEVVNVARKRLSALTGDEGPVNPELDKVHSNPVL